MDYEEALEIVNIIINKKRNIDLSDIDSIDKVRKDIIHELAEELMKAFKFGTKW